MTDKRRDSNGRLLKTWESQRKTDLIYQCRYNDVWGEIQYVYASDLNELREKETIVQKELEAGIDYSKGNISVLQLVERYISLKQNVRYNTKVGYQFVLNILKKEPFAQLWMIKLSKDGKGYSTLTSIRRVLKPAFDMASNEDMQRVEPPKISTLMLTMREQKHPL